MIEQYLKIFWKAHPATLVVMSYLAAIGIGASLLMTPFSTVSRRISFIDALFTATSAVCVTGLIVVDTGSYFTLFGQAIILVLIQIGGLGIMTISVFLLLSIGKSVSFRQRLIMQETFTHTHRQDIYYLVKAIIFFTVVVELMGAILLTVNWVREYPFGKALYMAVFHSVSAFCNAGFSLLSKSFMDYRSSFLLNLTICGLIILGGIGFPVVYEVLEKLKKNRQNNNRLSIQTKAVLLTTCLLILSGVLILFWGESGLTFKDFSLKERLLASLFQSVTARTAGFNTIDIAALSNASLFFIIFLMFIGASPGSCGGGVKTTTLAVLGAFTWSRLRKMVAVNLFHRTIPRENISRSISILVLSTGLIVMIFFLLLMSQQGSSADDVNRAHFLEYLFETVSAFGTVGLSMGVTATLSSTGKLLIILMMLIGRIGVLTFSYFIARPESRNGVEHAEEGIMIG